MLEIPISEIKYEDIKNLVERKKREDQRLDYKKDLYEPSGDKRKDLIKDCVAFANSSGGYILIGVSDEEGVPVEIVGVSHEYPDKEIRRMQELVKDNTDPSLIIRVKQVNIPDSNKCILVVYVEESYAKPHRVALNSNDSQFLGRVSSQNYAMDTDKIREAVMQSSKIEERIKRFKEDRVEQIKNNQASLPLQKGPTVVLHYIPQSSFSGNINLGLKELGDAIPSAPSFFDFMGNTRINLDGRVSFYGVEGQNVVAYTQVFRNGVIEVVRSGLDYESSGKKFLLTRQYEGFLFKNDLFFKKIGNYFDKVNIFPPIWVFLSILHVSNMYPHWTGYETEGPFLKKFDRNHLILPEFVIKDFQEDLSPIVKSTIDLVWNSAGVHSSRNFDGNGCFI